jgi:hypothetical protein
LPPSSKPNPRADLILRIASNVPILINIPTLPLACAGVRVSRCGCCSALLLFPFALALALAFHFAFEE